jgi:hypothetical protein
VDGIAGNLNDVALGSTESDTNGFYSFADIPPGQYYLEFGPLLQGQLFTQAGAGNDSGIDSDVAPASNRTDVLMIDIGIHALDIDGGILDTEKRWQNPASRFDVSNSDGPNPTTLDVVLVLRELKIHGNRRLDPNRDPPPAPFYDVSGDNRISPADVGQVLTKVLQPSGEGEQAISTELDEAFSASGRWWFQPLDDLWFASITNPRKKRHS